jgi:hypothetical protein
VLLRYYYRQSSLYKRLLVFEVTGQPLIRVEKIDTKETSCRILSLGNELILAEWNGCLEVYDTTVPTLLTLYSSNREVRLMI